MERVQLKLAIAATLFAGGYFLYAGFLGGGLLNGPGVIFVQ
jgi:hypothetical protein